MIDGKPDIISVMEREGIELKRRGHNLWALCPFHADKTPSFKVNIDRQNWYCFSENKGGDVIDLVMELHGLSFKDACKYLHIIPGKPAPVDPAIARQKKIQKDYETAIHNLWEKLCERSRALHKLKLKVKTNPGALTEQGASLFAGRMGELAEIDFKLDTLLKGSFEDKIILLRGNGDAYCGGEIRSAAA